MQTENITQHIIRYDCNEASRIIIYGYPSILNVNKITKDNITGMTINK